MSEREKGKTCICVRDRVQMYLCVRLYVSERMHICVKIYKKKGTMCKYEKVKNNVHVCMRGESVHRNEKKLACLCIYVCESVRKKVCICI